MHARANNGLPESEDALRVEAAVEAIGREQPAQERWAGVAADMLTAGEGAGMISQSSLQEFLWYRVPRKSPHEDWIRIAYGTLLLLDKLGLTRYADIAKSRITREILAAWEEKPGDGFKRFRSAMQASGVEPPDTDLLEWGQGMGMNEYLCRENVSLALEDAIVAGELRPGTSGWRKQAARVCERALQVRAADPGSPDASPARRIDLVLAERIESWVSGAREEPLKEWRRRAAETFLVDGLPVPPPAPSTESIAAAMASMTWLLTACRDGIKATAVGYLPPVLVREGAERFDWWPFPGQPRTEADLHPLLRLREIATRVGWLAKRSGRIRTTRSGIAALDDPVVMWRAITATVGREDAFSAAIGEVIAHRLLEGPAEWQPSDDFEALAQAAAPVIVAQGWQAGGRPVTPTDIDRSIHLPLNEWRFFGFVDEVRPRWVEGRYVGSYVTELNETGRAAAAAHLYARATEPRRHPFD